ncbi:MAG TPA: tetratricopeptide repeat protein [Gemmatimonadales bacterium]|nr:tetratricopeptide repeat protein [Gemmatimonadales bacterium]
MSAGITIRHHPLRETTLRHLPAGLAGLLLVFAARLDAQGVHDHVGLGTAAMQVHDLPTALAHYQAALALDSTDYEANWRASIVLLDQGEQIPDSIRSPKRDSLYALAERLARRAVAADSMGADGHFALALAVGRASLTMGKKERIRRARIIRDEAVRTIALNPRHDGAYHILGRWNAEIMRLSGLSRFFAKSLLGAGIFGEASWEGAISNMEQAVALDPGRLYHHLELAQIYVDRKRYQDARTQLQEIETLPDREIMDSVYRRQARALAAKLRDRH